MADGVNDDGLLPGEADYRPLEDQMLRGVPREMVLRMAANVLARCFPIEALQAIYQDGFDKFHAIAREAWHEHGFTTDEYRKGFEIVEAAMKDRLMKREGIKV